MNSAFCFRLYCYMSWRLTICKYKNDEFVEQNNMMIGEDEMPFFYAMRCHSVMMRCHSVMMRCGEWWASSPVLQGSRHPCPLLPTTHLADFLSTRWMQERKTETWMETVFLYWLVEGFLDEGPPSSPPDLLRFWSVQPMYFLPVMQVANCLAFTWYLSYRPHCVVPSLNVFMILKSICSR